MNTKCADLTVKKSADHDVVKVLEDAGFILVLDCATTTEKHYIVAESECVLLTYEHSAENEEAALEKKIEHYEKALDKMRAELHATAEMHEDGSYYIRDEWIDECFDKYFYKYIAEQEAANGQEN